MKRRITDAAARLREELARIQVEELPFSAAVEVALVGIDLATTEVICPEEVAP